MCVISFIYCIFSNPYVTEFERDRETTFLSFVANIGGIHIGFLENLITTSILGLMGLCMGFSFVSLAEIFYYLTLTVWSALEKERRVRKTMEIGEVGDMDCD